MSVVVLTEKKADSTAASDARYIVGALTGVVDPNGVGALDLAAGHYSIPVTAGGVSTVLEVYVPNLEGPFDVSQLFVKRPDAAADWAGASGTWAGLDAQTVTPTEQTLDVNSVDGGIWPAGRCMSGSAIIDGKVFIAGAPTNINAITPNGISSVVSIYDPATATVRHVEIPTSTGVSHVTSPSNPLVGGSDNVSVEAVTVANETWACVLSSCPYPIGSTQWPITSNGVFPSIAVLRKVGGVWQVDTAKSMTADDLRASGAVGALAFPNNTNAFGETFAQNLGLAKLAVTPISQRLATCQYFQDEPNTGYRGGRFIIIDPATKTVLAKYETPYVGDSYSQDGQTLHTMSPREIQFDPTSTIGHERFFVIYDEFQVSGSFEINQFQVLEYDDVAHTITPLSQPLGNDFVNISHWTDGAWDSTGGLFLATRKGLVPKGLSYFPQVDGAIKPTRAPYGWSGSIVQGIGLLSDFTADFDVSLPSGSFSFNRSKFDPTTKCLIHPAAGALAAITPVHVDGDPHAPVLTPMPWVNPGVQTYLSTLQTGNGGNWQDPGIDVGNRVIAIPLATWDTTKNTPELFPQWCFTADLDRIAQKPVFGRSAHTAQINKTSYIVPLSTGVLTGDFYGIFMTLNLNTDPATGPISITGTWTKLFDVRNGGAGIRYVFFYKLLAAAEPPPTVSWTGSSNFAIGHFYFRGVDATTPVDSWAQSLGPAGGSDLTIPRPSITPSVAGCRVLGLYGAAGQVSGVPSYGEVTPGEIARMAQVGTGFGTGPSIIVTQEEQTASTSPTRARQAQFSATGLKAGFTLALRPSATPPAPKAVASIACVPNPVANGATTVATVTLASAADRNTAVVVTSSNTAKATVRNGGTCIVLAGATTGTVTIDAVAAGSSTISAYSGSGSAQTTSLTVS